MIKKWQYITIGDLALTEDTGSVKHYRTKYRFIPVHFVIKKIASELEILYGKLNETKNDIVDEILETEYLLKCRIELIKAQNLDAIIANNLGNKIMYKQIIDKICMLLPVKKRKFRKFNNGSDILKYAFSKIEELTKIKIEKEEDVLKFKKYLKQLIDKVETLSFVPEENEEKKTGIITYTSMYLRYLKIDVSRMEQMRVATFLKHRDEANRQILKDQANQLKNEAV